MNTETKPNLKVTGTLTVQEWRSVSRALYREMDMLSKKGFSSGDLGYDFREQLVVKVNRVVHFALEADAFEAAQARQPSA